MVFLFLSILTNVMMTLSFKYAAAKNYNSDRITLYNYLICWAIAILMVSTSRQWGRFAAWENIRMDGLFDGSINNSLFFVLFCGLISGAVYLVNLLMMKYSIVHNGASITSVFSKTGFIIPAVAAVFLWNEMPGGLHWAGIVLASIAIALLVSKGGKKSSVRRPAVLAVMFVLSGIVELSSKVFTIYGIPDDKPLLLFVIFSTALFFCIPYILILSKRQGAGFALKKEELILGACVGVPNIFSSF